MHLSYLAIFPVTGLTVAGYITLYFAMASQGKMKTFGKILAVWAFLLAALVAIAAIACPALGLRPHGMMSMHEQYWHGMMDRDGTQGPPPGTQAPDGLPAPPPSAPQN